jgi:hypothetical protein
MTGGIGLLARTLADAPFTSPDMVAKIGDGIWLYVRCLSLATASGHVCRARVSLARDLGVPEEQVDRWVATLVDARLVALVSTGPFLVLKLSFWSTSEAFPDSSTLPSTDAIVQAREEVPVGSKQRAAAASSKQGDRGLGEGANVLDEAVLILGPEARGEIAEIIDRTPAPHVRKALRRVALTPDRQIKKSKLALFRYLLAKFTDETP